MIRGAKNTCSSCARFPAAALETTGQAECAIYRRPAEYADPACVLYEAASDRAARRMLVARLNETKGVA